MQQLEADIIPITTQVHIQGITEAQAKAYIYQHESGNNPNAINTASGACGLGQSLPCSKMPCSLGDYTCEDNYFTQYAISRYGGWIQAYNFWISHKWW